MRLPSPEKAHHRKDFITIEQAHALIQREISRYHQQVHMTQKPSWWRRLWAKVR